MKEGVQEVVRIKRLMADRFPYHQANSIRAAALVNGRVRIGLPYEDLLDSSGEHHECSAVEGTDFEVITVLPAMKSSQLTALMRTRALHLLNHFGPEKLFTHRQAMEALKTIEPNITMNATRPLLSALSGTVPTSDVQWSEYDSVYKYIQKRLYYKKFLTEVWGHEKENYPPAVQDQINNNSSRYFEASFFFDQPNINFLHLYESIWKR